MIARIATEIALDKLFDYIVPTDLIDQITIGQRVEVPFGNRKSEGYVIELVQQKAECKLENPNIDLFGNPVTSNGTQQKLKQIGCIIDKRPFLSPAMVNLARWIADYTCTPLEICLRCALPAPVRNSNHKPKELLYVTPQAQPDNLTPRQQELYDNLVRVDGGWMHSLMREFSCSAHLFKALKTKGGVTITPRQIRRDPMARRKILPTSPMPLMPEQKTALKKIISLLRPLSLHPPGTYASSPDLPPLKPLLLHGVTGSGKTEVYLQAIQHVLDQGYTAIILVPEIALTPQTVQRFAARFGEHVAVLHSGLSDGERFDEWHRIRDGNAKVVVGPRSAVFAPLNNLGLIVVDEEHEPSYKQEEAPRYNARDIAVMRGFMQQCGVILGSATPSMESWLNVQKGKYEIANLTTRVAGRAMPRIRLVDMRIESLKHGTARIFSQELLEALKLRLERGEQSILFLNRRGYSNSLQCQKCGFAQYCDACNITMTYHRSDSCLRCHICGAWSHLPDVCPNCGDPSFRYAGYGTQRVESALRTCFPKARLLRMDTDVTTRKHNHDELLSRFRSGKAEIMIGTQMIAKGLDFPNVTLVGVLLADMSLHIPDFRASERTYQLLAQVSGRAGRAELPGEVFIQTYQPEHPAIQAAASAHGFAAFAKQELAERHQGKYPPFRRMVCLTFRSKDEKHCANAAFKIEQYLQENNHHANMKIYDASPAPLAKAKGYYRYQILMFAPNTRTMTNLLRQATSQVSLPNTVFMTIDVDALNIA